LLLALDTAGPVVGAAVARGEQSLGSWSARVVRGTERRLIPAVQELLQGQSPDCVVVSIGPGAFTGLRVGLATALGLASAAGCPLVGVSSLQARAALVPGKDQVLALLDARKSRVYAGLYDTRPTVPVLLGGEADLVAAQALPEGPVLAIGEGVFVAGDELGAAGCSIAPWPDRCPTDALTRIGLARFEAGEVSSAEELRLSYIRPPDAKPPRDLVARQRG